jgi:hypothetical protein
VGAIPATRAFGRAFLGSRRFEFRLQCESRVLLVMSAGRTRFAARFWAFFDSGASPSVAGAVEGPAAVETAMVTPASGRALSAISSSDMVV